MLITGGTGFIGLSIIYAINLINTHFDTSIEIDIVSRNKRNISKDLHFKNVTKINFINRDLSKNKIPVSKRYDSIIHLANNPSSSNNNSKQILSCTKNLIKSFSSQIYKPEFILFSSGAVYNDKNNKPLHENSKKVSLNKKKSSEYSRGKLESEIFLKKNMKDFKKILIFRGFTFIGFKKKLNKDYLIDQIFSLLVMKKNQKLNINTNGKVYRSYMNTIDAACLIISSINSNHKGIFNLGSDEALSIKSLEKKLNKYFPNRIKINYLDIVKKPYSRAYYIPNINKLKKEFKYKKFINLEKSITLILNEILLTSK